MGETIINGIIEASQEIAGRMQYAIGAKGDTGDSGVYIGTTPPTDPNIKVWIDTSEESGDVEMTSNKVTSISSESTDIQYPSAKAVKKAIDSNIDQTYSPTSANAQSGKAVAEAVSAEQNRADNTFANALRGSASGETINLTDVSPNEHTLNVKIHSKNLWQHTGEAAYLNRASYESDTHLYTVNTGGVIWYVHTFQNPIPKNTAVSVTVEVISGNGTVSIGGYHKESGKNSWQGYVEIPKNTDLSGKTYTASFTTNDTVTDLCIFADSNSTIAEPVIFRVQYEIGSTATAYTPYVPDLTAVKVKRCGKNLFDINGFINLTGNSTYYGINDNGELYIKQSDYRDDTAIPVFITLEAGTYTLSSTTAITSSFKLINLTDNKVIAFNNNITFSIEKATSLGIKYWQSANTVIGKLQLEIGTTATDYEPYKECADYTPTADGTVNGVTSLYPNTTLMTDTERAIIEAEYNRDINKAFAALEAAIATNNS